MTEGESFRGSEEEGTDTQLEVAAVRPDLITSFEVAGLRLGMSLKEANRIAGRAGFRPSVGSDTNYSFEGRARLIANSRIQKQLTIPHTVPNRSNAQKPDGGTVNVDWLPTPVGVRIREVRFATKTNGNSASDLQKQVIAKFGRPTLVVAHGEYVGAYWCSAGERHCEGFGSSLPSLKVEISPSTISLDLSQGWDAQAANEKAIELRATQLASEHARGVSL